MLAQNAHFAWGRGSADIFQGLRRGASATWESSMATRHMMEVDYVIALRADDGLRLLTDLQNRLQTKNLTEKATALHEMRVATSA